MIVYYTGTGNSRYAAEAIAHYTGDEIFNATEALIKCEKANLSSEKPWVFVSPTYCWRMPKLFEKWLREGKLEGSREAYFVMTCGSDIGNAEKYLRRFCADMGFKFRGVQEIIMPENYVAMFPVPKEGTSLKIIRKADPVIERAASLINEGGDLEGRKVGILEKLKSGPVNPAFYAFAVKSKPFVVSDACISCGKCAKKCPVQGIDIVDGKPVWNGECTHCMACICSCPQSAIEYGKISVGKPRYQCPHFEVK